MRSKTDFIKSLKNKEYQARRNKMLFENLEKDEEKLKIKLNKIYKSESTKLDRQIAQYYAQYGKDNVIEYRKLLNNLSSSEVDLLMKDLDNFINKYPQHENIRGVRESIYKLDRLEGLRLSIDMQQLELAEKEKSEIEKYLLNVYEKGTIDSLNRLGHGTNFSAFNKEVARKFINEKWIDGKSLSNRIYENRSKVASFMTSEFRNGVIRGDSYRNISKALTDKFTEVSSRNAMRLIRTEGTRVMNESTITLFENEFEEYRYSAIFDDRTSQVCMDLDGQVFKMKERQAGVNFPPMHPNCRSSYDIEVPKFYLQSVFNEIKENDDSVEKHDEKEYNINKGLNFNNATRKVLEHGRKTGNEGLIWLDLDGNEIMEFKTGNKNSVRISKGTINYLKSLEKNSVVSLHNHPSSSSFSSSDMSIACKIESIKETRVIGHDGTKYFLEIGEGQRPEFDIIDDTYYKIKNKLQHKYQKMFNEIKDSQLVWKEHSHEINKELAKKFNWRYRRELK